MTYGIARHLALLSLMPVISAAQTRGLPIGREHDVRESQPSRQAFIQQYCISCHHHNAPTGGVSFDDADPEHPQTATKVWEKVVRKIRSREMPPPGMPHPDPKSADAFAASIVGSLDAAAERAPFAGRPVIRRLNRVEYANAVRDLLGVDARVADELPPDDTAGGFDNIGDALSLSPLLLERYLKVSRKVSEYAVGISDPSPVIESFSAPEDQSRWLGPGLPFGSRGGIRVSYYFPSDGDYSLRAFLGTQKLPPTEGVRFFQTRVHVNAGAHVVVVTFPDEFAEREGPIPNSAGIGGAAMGGPLDPRGSAIHSTVEFRLDRHRVNLFEIGGLSAGEAALNGEPGPPTMDHLEISGPYDARGISDAPSRKKIFVCRPAVPDRELPCVSKILSSIVRRAFRRDVVPSDVAPFIAAFQAERRQHGFDQSIAASLQTILLAPDFLFRLEFDPPNVVAGSARKISDWELATRLSFFLWKTIPDDALLNLASNRRLSNASVFKNEARRLLADPRATSIADSLADQWLGLRRLAEVKPDRQAFPEFGGGLTADFAEETRLFVRSILSENRSVLDFIGADYTYLNERLARLYGIPGVLGPGFRRVSVAANPERGGLLGQGSILLLTSHTTKTSPILRGKWILSVLLNSPPAPPPPGVPPLDETPAAGRNLSIREQIERHQKNVACASCHARMDPLGFALENFDVIGKWRTQDASGPLDVSGRLPDGSSISGPRGLKQHLLQRPDDFAETVACRLLTYAIGRELDERDRPAIRKIVNATATRGYRLQDLIVAIVESVPFQMRQTRAGQ